MSMDELTKLYNLWSENQTDNEKVKEAWKNIVQHLSKSCLAEEMDRITSEISEYSFKIENQAFIAGYRQAFLLMLEILNP